jgi:large repetitive protein
MKALLLVLFALLAAAASAIAGAVADRADAAATFVVNDTATAPDSRPGDGRCATRTGVCTLRAAIHETNSLSGADTIQLPAGTYPISRPATQPNDIRTGDLDVLDELTISGAGSASTIISGGRLDRVFEVSSSGGVSINDVTIRAGSHPQSGAGILNSGNGSLTLLRSVVLNNSAAKFGGGIANAEGGAVQLRPGTRLSGNSAGEAGSAVANLASGTIAINGVKVTSNSSTLGGAAIVNTGISPNEGRVNLVRATVASNVAGSGTNPGGGISNSGDGSLRVDGSTISENRSADSGGGIANPGRGTVEVVNSKIAGNKSEADGGGISNAGQGMLTVASSTFSNNATAGDGGGIQSAEKAGVSIIGSSFTGNSALDGGGIHTSGDAGAIVRDTTLSANNASQDGGGLNNNGTTVGPLTIERVSFSGNQATGDGGGLILQGGSATIASSQFAANSAADGGGFANHSGGVVTLEDSTFTENTAQDHGGGIENASDGAFAVARIQVSGNKASVGGGIDNVSDAAFTVADSEVSGNQAARGGGLTSNIDAHYIVENTTVSANTATVEGGGMIVLDPITLASTTITNNSAPVGGGIQKIGDSRLLVRNTIIANNPGGNCGYERGTLPIESEGGNLDSGVSCGLTDPTDISGADPLLGPLQDNGGPTRTHALDPASLAIDGAITSTCPAEDQRGVARPQNEGCDMGAYEVDGAIAPPACPDRGTHLAPAAADSWVNQGDPGKNFGTDPALTVRTASVANARALLRFNLPPLPAGCNVLAAVLRLHAGTSAPDHRLRAFRLGSRWTESEVTWENQPATVGTAATAISATGTVQWAVTGQVREMYSSGRNHGFMIRDAVEGASAAAEQAFDSREAPVDQPQLAVVLG